MRTYLPKAPRRILRALVSLAAAGLALVVALGFFGGALPAFDSLAQFRAHASLALAVLAVPLLLVRRIGAGLGALATAALGVYSVLPFVLPARPAATRESGAPRYTLLQMNLRFDAPDPARALALIAELRPDVVTAQEMTLDWRDAFDRLRSAYPHQFFCTPPFQFGNDTAILSRRPFVETPARDGERTVCRDDEAFSAKTIDFNGLPVTVGSQHLRWPWPGRQTAMVDALAPTLARLADPLIIGGDFNSAPWTASVRRYAEASRTRVLAGVGPTWIASLVSPSLARFAGLPIDNVLASDGIEVLDVETLDATTSDHLPVLVTFTMRFALPEEPDVQSAGR